jgi:DNA-binding IclR family transcriptional regulator
VARTNRLRVRFLAELDPNGRYELAFVAAPVLNEEGKVAFALNLFGFDRVCGGGEVASIANQLREACLRISTFISGKRVAAGPRPHPVARM